MMYADERGWEWKKQLDILEAKHSKLVCNYYELKTDYLEKEVDVLELKLLGLIDIANRDDITPEEKYLIEAAELLLSGTITDKNDEIKTLKDKSRQECDQSPGPKPPATWIPD